MRTAINTDHSIKIMPKEIQDILDDKQSGEALEQLLREIAAFLAESDKTVQRSEKIRKDWRRESRATARAIKEGRATVDRYRGYVREFQDELGLPA